MSWRLNVVATLVAVGGVTVAASADVTDLTISGALDDPSLHLPEGWQEGQDWGWSPEGAGALSWVDEHWIGMDQVDLNVNVVGGGGTDITLTKSLLNDTDFEWTSFLIELTPLPGQGPIIIDDSSASSSLFGDHTTTNDVDGSASILFFDGSVGSGASVSFFFTFNIAGSVAFEMVQTPVPAPGGLAALGLGVLAMGRRRR